MHATGMWGLVLRASLVAMGLLWSAADPEAEGRHRLELDKLTVTDSPGSAL